jgi:aspartate racemase
MKTIGLIGGISWQSSVHYYEILNRKVQETLGGAHSCQCLMYSVDFAEIADLQHKGAWDALSDRMIHAAQLLERGGADIILLCANTMHKCAGDVENNIRVPLLHIVDPTGEEILKRGLRKVGLLATRFSMEEDFLRKRFREKYAADTIIPEENARKDIHRTIFEELVKGIFTDASRRRFLAIIDALVAQGAEGIIAGCTEIELLIAPRDVRVPFFPTAKLHAESAVRFALAG